MENELDKLMSSKWALDEREEIENLYTKEFFPMWAELKKPKTANAVHEQLVAFVASDQFEIWLIRHVGKRGINPVIQHLMELSSTLIQFMSLNSRLLPDYTFQINYYCRGGTSDSATSWEDCKNSCDVS